MQLVSTVLTLEMNGFDLSTVVKLIDMQSNLDMYPSQSNKNITHGKY